MSTLPPAPARAAIYARVSTEDQAERQTIQSQLDFLRKYCDLHEIDVAGEYVDDGWSGALALEDRPEGRRLLDDAERGTFRVVLVYRLDRLGRSLKALLAAHERLERTSVAIRSATEPFDTTSPIGSFLFQLLGSLAQLERATITERTQLGRDRVARDGQYTGGPIPLGYDLDESNRFIRSKRVVPIMGITEAELVQGLFTRIASGESTLNRECGRLTALGVPRRQRYGGARGRVIERVSGWGLSSLGSIIHNPIYKGAGVVESRFGEVVRPAEPLVDHETWEGAQRALVRNRSLSKKNAKNEYLLRGLVKCGLCGLTFVGTTTSGVRKYRCNANGGRANSRPEGRCQAASIDADRLESLVWHEVRQFVENPGEAVEVARQQIRERLAASSKGEEQRKRLAAELAGKETERERILGLFRRGRITSDEAERELDSIAREAAQLRELLDSLRLQAQMAEAQETYLVDAGAMLARVRGRVDEIEAANDRAAKRELIELLAPRIVLQTDILGIAKVRQRKRATIHLTLAFQPENTVVSTMRSPGVRRWKRPGSSLRSGASTVGSA